MINENKKLPELPENIVVTTEAGCIDIFENVFSKDISKKIIEIVEESNELLECPILYSNASIGDGRPGGSIRSNLLLEIIPHLNNFDQPCSCRIQEIHAFIQEIFAKCVRYYSEKYEIEIAYDEGFQLLKYSPGKEYKPHCDQGPGVEWRVLSGLILLNPDEYEGGATYFNNYDINIKPKNPSIVLFPSNYAYTHRARAVLDGTKYAIVTWFGPPWMNKGFNNE